MTIPTHTLSGYRLVSIQVGDTLRLIALRELGDANLWRDLIAINDLVAPYITEDPDLAGPKVRLVGGQLKVPAPAVRISSADDPVRVFGADLALIGGKLGAAGGDLAIVAGTDNLKQAYTNRIDTRTGELEFHPRYGCRVHELKGEKNTAMAATLGGAYVKDALLNDPRTDSVQSVTVQVQADALVITATAQAISGSSVDIQSAG